MTILPNLDLLYATSHTEERTPLSSPTNTSNAPLSPDRFVLQVKGFPEIKVFYNGRIGYQATGAAPLMSLDLQSAKS